MGIYKYNHFSIRLAGYDYSQPGYYFITLVTQNRDKKFGVIFNKKMQLNNVGRMIAREWNQIPERFENAVLDKYIIMPDHFHGIIKIIPNKNHPITNKNNAGKPLVGIYLEKLIVQNKNPYVHPKKIPVHDKLSFVKNRDINTGLQNEIYGSTNIYGKIHNVYGGSQSTGTSPEPSGKPSLLDIIGAFKSITTNMYINGIKNNNWPRFKKRLWQLRFHDRIIRDANELNRIREYIIANPVNYHPRNK